MQKYSQFMESEKLTHITVTGIIKTTFVYLNIGKKESP